MPKQKPKIAIDIDDVIAESSEALRELVNQKTGRELTKEDYRVPGEYRGYYEVSWRQHDIDIDFRGLEAIMETDQSHVGLVAGAQYAVNELLQEYDVVLITSRSASMEHATRDWIETHFSGKLPELHFATSRFDRSRKTKGQLCKELGASWLIDDNPEHCQTALDEGVAAILFGEYGWHHSHPEKVIKCTSWPAVLEYFSNKSERYE